MRSLRSLPSREAGFVEPMECLAVAKLPDGGDWVYEILCGGPHKISVASGVMWCWRCGAGTKRYGTSSYAT